MTSSFSATGEAPTDYRFVCFVCFVTDPDSGQIHLELGMDRAVTIT